MYVKPERTGLGIVRRQLKAYGECYPNLVKHDRRFPTIEYLWKRTVTGYDAAAGLKLMLAPLGKANHPPQPHCQGDGSGKVVFAEAPVGKPYRLTAAGTSDPDGDRLSYRWYVYPEAGTYAGQATIAASASPQATLDVPADAAGRTMHVILEVTDSGEPALTRYRRIVVTGASDAK